MTLEIKPRNKYMSHDTGNDLESSDILDFSDNCENLDVLMNADQDYWTDRFGNKKPTIDYALRMAGFTPAGFDFTTGGVLKNGDRNKCVFNQADQTWYSWSGDLPYNVIAGSVPGEGWKVVNRNALTIAREALRRTYKEAGYNLVDGSFEQGAVLVNVNDVLLQERTGKVFSGLAGTVTAGTNPSSGGFVDRSDVLFSSTLGNYQFDITTNSFGRQFLNIKNSDTGEVVMTLPDGSSPGDSSIFKESLETRRDGHTLLSTAGTVGGKTDIAFRTSGLSDYIYLQAGTTYGNTTLAFLIDTKPARPDGTKKDGTGGGGQLPVSDDVYRFDAALQMRSNVIPNISDIGTCLMFPVAPAVAEQGFGVRRRGQGVNTYYWTFDGNENSKLVCVESNNTLMTMYPKGIEVGGIYYQHKLTDYSVTPICSDSNIANAQFKVFRGSVSNSSITTSAPLEIKLVNSGIHKVVDITANIRTTGNIVYVYKATVVFSSGALTILGTPTDTTPSQINPSVSVDGAGNLILSIVYTGGIGGAIRATVDYNIT